MDISNIYYEVVFSDSAKIDLEEIYKYISNHLLAKKSADNIMERIEKNILRLEQYPYSCSEITVKPHKDVFRKLIIDNYIVLYAIDEKYKRVIIYNIVYSKRDYLT